MKDNGNHFAAMKVKKESRPLPLPLRMLSLDFFAWKGDGAKVEPQMPPAKFHWWGEKNERIIFCR